MNYEQIFKFNCSRGGYCQLFWLPVETVLASTSTKKVQVSENHLLKSKRKKITYFSNSTLSNSYNSAEIINKPRNNIKMCHNKF